MITIYFQYLVVEFSLNVINIIHIKCVDVIKVGNI